MPPHRNLTSRQCALLRRVAAAGADGADVLNHPPATVRSCDLRGLITCGDLSPAGSRRFITQLGIDVLAYHDAIGTHPRGFAAMSPMAQREIASKGGRVAHATGAAHEFRAGDPATIAAAKKSRHRRPYDNLIAWIFSAEKIGSRP